MKNPIIRPEPKAIFISVSKRPCSKVPTTLPTSPPEETFISQCEADYERAELTALAHIAPDKRLTLLLAVVELLHKHLEPNPLIGLSPPSGYPRRISLGDRGGTLIVQRWHAPSVRDGVQWYRSCASGSIAVPSTNPTKPTGVQLGQLGDDPPWPHCIVEVENFWPHSEFWGNRPGGSRWHRLLPLEPVEITNGWQAPDFEKARAFLMAEVHVDLLSRSVLLGSCHLRLPNPVYRRLQQSVSDDWQSINFDVELYPNQLIGELELTFWNRRAWGATQVRRMTLRAGRNMLIVPEGVEQVAHAVYCEKRGLLEQSEQAGFFSAVEVSMNIVTEQRRVEEAGSQGGYTIGIVGHSQNIQAGTPRPANAIARLAADEAQQRVQKAWSETSFRWFDGDSIGGAQAIRDIIGSARERVDLLDPYFSRSDLLRFALATTRHGLPLRVLTSADFCTSKEPELKIEQGDALAKTLDSVRAQDPRLNIEIKVMAGQKSPVHDRFLIVDGTVWVLGASFNEFGNRGSLLMKLPSAPAHDEGGSPAFSVSRSIFDEHWNRPDTASTPLHEWVKRRAASRAGPQIDARPKTFSDRVRATRAVIDDALRRVCEVWHA